MSANVKSVAISGIDINDLWKATGMVETDDPNAPLGTFSIPLTEGERAELSPLLDKLDKRIKEMIGDLKN